MTEPSTDKNLLGDVFLPSPPLKHSHVHSVSPSHLLPWTIGQTLEHAFEEYPDNEAFVIGDTNARLTYREIRNRSRDFAKGFLALGLSKYDVIYMAGVQNNDWLYLFFAAQYIGVVVMVGPQNRPYKKDFDRILEKGQFKVVVVGPRQDNELFGAVCENILDKDTLKPRTSVRHVFCQSGEFANHEVVEKRGLQSVDTLLELGKSVTDMDFQKAFDSVYPEDPAYICTSSGSTGAPKLVALTHRSSVNAGKFGFLQLHGYDQNETLKIAFLGPWCDILLSTNMICSVLVQRPRLLGVVLPAPVDAIGVPTLELLEKERCTHCMMWPAYYLELMGNPNFNKFDLTSLRGGVISGQKFSRHLFEKMMETFPDLTYGYGTSETNLITTTIPTDPNYERKVSTVGYPLPFYELKVVDENYQIVPINKQGELWVRSSWGLFWGYWNDPEMLKKLMTNGWVRTGDLATLAPDGFLTIIGRISDAIRFKRFADIVYPGPIEDKVREHKNIKEAKIVATEDDFLGDMLHLFVTAYNGQLCLEELKEFCKNNLMDVEMPEHIYILKSLPLTGGRHKIDGRRLKEMALANLVKESDETGND